jgi:perosamine synthetase
MLTTGEGGLVLTDDEVLARRARLAMNLGERTSDGRPTGALERFDPALGLEYELAGANHRMGALQAALGLAQLGRLEPARAAGRANAARLRSALREAGLAPQQCPEGGEPSPSVVFLAVEAERARIGRDELATALAAERIDCRKAYAVPLPAHPLFGAADGWRERWPVATRLCERGLGVRVDARLGPREIDATVRALARISAWARSR